tara:strand:+ start:519 stop:815 length:297 start_codon:yes stop_codon:yes gene_type:complete
MAQVHHVTISPGDPEVNFGRSIVFKNYTVGWLLTTPVFTIIQVLVKPAEIRMIGWQKPFIFRQWIGKSHYISLLYFRYASSEYDQTEDFNRVIAPEAL